MLDIQREPGAHLQSQLSDELKSEVFETDRSEPKHTTFEELRIEPKNATSEANQKEPRRAPLKGSRSEPKHVTFAENRTEPKTVEFNADQIMTPSEQLPQDEEEEELDKEATEDKRKQKQMRAWGSNLNEACCDPEAWQNAPLPPSLLKWPSEPELSNACATSLGPTCDDFLKQIDGTEALEGPQRIILPMESEFQAAFDHPDNAVPIQKPLVAPCYAPKANVVDPVPPRYVTRAEYWQSIRPDPWDRPMNREIVKKPPDVLPDAKAPSKKQICRKYGKDSDWLPLDDELLDLIKTDSLRTELKQPMSGYTGARRKYCNPCWPRSRDDSYIYNDYMYKSSTHLAHRCFPSSVYVAQTTQLGRKGPVSRTISNLVPPHPFRLYKPERFGRWDTDVPAHKLW